MKKLGAARQPLTLINVILKKYLRSLRISNECVYEMSLDCSQDSSAFFFATRNTHYSWERKEGIQTNTDNPIF